MFTIADLLQKFKTIRDPQQDKKIIQDIIKEFTGAEVPLSEITLREHKISLKTHPGLRNVIYTRKFKILEKIQQQEELKNHHFTDIV